MTVSPEKPPRGWDPRYFAAWRSRVQALAARARDPAERARRIERLALVAEHGGAWVEALDLARTPLVLDLSAEIPQPRAPRHPPSRQPRPHGSVRASAGARLRRVRETTRRSAPPYRGGRGLVASALGDGTFRVSYRGRPIPNVALTASGSLVEYVDKEPDDAPGGLSSESVLRFGDLVVGFARELARR
jgi:hypothetical protein